MCRLLFYLNYDKKITITKNIILQFLEQSITKKYTPELNNSLDADYHKDGYGLAFLNNNLDKFRTSCLNYKT